MRFALLPLLTYTAFATESIPCDVSCAQSLISSTQSLISSTQSYKSHKKLTHNPFPTMVSQTPTAKPHYLKLEAILNTKALIDGTWYAMGKTPFGTITGIYADHITLAQGSKIYTIKISQNIVWYK